MTASRSGGPSKRTAWFAYLSAAVALTGVQLIAPSLPVMRDALGLTDAQLALVMSLYLLPAALMAIPIGLLADRYGRRVVLGSSLVVFGLCGAAIPSLAENYQSVLALRFVQGAAFSGILPMTMTILGDSFSGFQLVGAHGRRALAMSAADGALPMIGGLLAGLSWFAPWYGQVLAVPLGIAVWFNFVDPGALDQRMGRIEVKRLLHLFTSRKVLAVQYAGFLRMFLKFSILTFLPVLLVDSRGLSPGFVGLVLGFAALSGTLVAVGAERLARVGRPTRWIASGMGLMGLGIAGLVTMPTAPLIAVAALLYGGADGLGVFVNSMVTVATDTSLRASFVATTGAIRNLAKFTAPTAFGLLALAIPLAPGFLILAGIAAASTLTVRALRPYEPLLVGNRSQNE